MTATMMNKPDIQTKQTVNIAKLMYFVSLKSLILSMIISLKLMLRIPADMPSHVAIHSAHDHKDEVVALDTKELFQVDITDLNVPAIWINIY